MRIRKCNARRKKPRRVRGTRVSRAIQLAGYEELERIAKPMIDEVIALGDWLEQVATPAEAAAKLHELHQRWRGVYDREAVRFARKWIEAINQDQKTQFEKRLAQAFGVQQAVVFDDAHVFKALETMSSEAVEYIRLIPEKYFTDVKLNVMKAYQQHPLPDNLSLQEYLRHTYHLSEYQSRRLARDQASKVHTAVVQARQTQIGVEEYIWRTAEDERVVGTPGGLYVKPNKLHGNHYLRNGKIFRWDSPPSDGHAGFPIQCLPGDTKVCFPDGVCRIWRRWYEGELICITSQESKEDLCMTPGHPVLTGRGWKLGHELLESDVVVRLVDKNVMALPIELVWEVVGMLGSIHEGERGFTFHGDIGIAKIEEASRLVLPKGVDKTHLFQTWTQDFGGVGRMECSGKTYTCAKIERIQRKKYQGHVYTPETPCGYYVAQGLVNHNCRCWSEPVLDVDKLHNIELLG